MPRSGGKTSPSKESPTKKKKRVITKRPRDKNAPTRALSAYHFFYRNRHALIPQSERSKRSGDVNRQIASEWSTLSDENKKEFVTLAEEDRGRYSTEFELYKKTDAYKSFQKLLKKHERETRQKNAKECEEDINQWIGHEKRAKRKHVDALIDQKDWTPPTDSIPIFSETFLEHNREREVVLRRLRKQLIEAEEENALLSKHVENLTSAKETLHQSVAERSQLHSALTKEFDSLKLRLADGLSSVSLPGRLFEDCIPDQLSVVNYLDAVTSLLGQDPIPEEDARILSRIDTALSEVFK